VSAEATTPFTDAELGELPVFPLPRVVFFPGTKLPLHIFEPRYRAMMEDCLARGPRAMAIALLEPGWEADYEGQPKVHRIAGAGRIVEHVRRADGRFDLILYGIARVQLEELPLDRVYRRARATVIADRIPHEDAVMRLIPSLLSTASSIATRVRERHPDFDLGVDAKTPPGLIADRIADRLVANIDERQRLLAQADVKVRIAALQDVLFSLLAQIEAGRGPSQ
jgi:Lon protease-like protein